MKKRRTKTGELSPEVVFAVCTKFVNGERVSSIADTVNAEFKLNLTREQVYPIVTLGTQRRYIQLHPPLQDKLQTRIRDLFRLPDSKSVHVVSALRGFESQSVAIQGASVVFDLIKDLHRKRRKTQESPSVHIGIGSGNTTQLLARELKDLLLGELPPADLPKLVFHALTPGIMEEQAIIAPVATFTYFRELPVEPDFIGLFSKPFVSVKEHEREKNDSPAFQKAGDVDIVITSLASSGDDHGLLRQLLGPDACLELSNQQWVGDLLYRPYSRKKPITATEKKVLVIFEIEELVAMVNSNQEDKYVVLVVPPCKECGTSLNGLRSDALRPLLEEPELNAWTHLVTDIHTAGQIFHNSNDH